MFNMDSWQKDGALSSIGNPGLEYQVSMDTVYDRALSEVGHDGRFQKSFDVIYNFFMIAIWGMAYMNVVLALVVIPHSCQLPPKPDNVTELQWKEKHLPLSIDAKGESTFSSCLMYENYELNNDTVSCKEFKYDKTWYESTAATEYNWVCENELYVADVYAYSRVGEIVGSFFLGWFGDVFGRRLTYIITTPLTILGRVVTLFAGNSFIVFVLGCVMTSVPSGMASQSTIVISMETSSAERRTFINTLKSIGWATGLCVMPLLYWWLREWRMFVIVTTAGLIPYVLFSWTLIESPRWLWIEGRHKECVKVLKRIAKSNGRRLDKNTEIDILKSTPPKDSKGLGPLALFSSWSLALNTIFQLTIWISLTVAYTVLLISSGESSSGNPFLEFAWQSAAEVPGNFIGAWLADTIGRRYSGGFSLVIAAVLWIVVAIRSVSTIVWIQNWWVGTTLSILIRLALTVTVYVVSLFNMELYPTCLRQSGMSLGFVVSSGSSAFGPYILYMGRNLDARLPGAILTGVSLIGALSCLLLPETLNSKLPETLEDAKNFGSGDRKYFSLRLQRPASSVGKESIVYYKNDISSSIVNDMEN